VNYGLVALNGDEYKTHRKAINPLFTPKALRSFIPVMNQEAERFIRNFDLNLTTNAFDVSDETLLFTLNLSLKIFFGLEQFDRKACVDFIDNSER
jgi:cytochrome P450